MSKVVYNNLSEEFKKKIGWGVPLQRDEVVEFQWINIPVIKQNNEMLPVYSMKRLPNTDAIFDPIQKEMVQIAYVTNELKNTEDNPTGGLGEIEFKKEEKCTITISGRDTSKMNLLYYLRAHSLNQTNALASPSNYGFVFKELEPVKSAKQKLKERLELNSCVNYIDDMKEADLVALLKGLKLPTFKSLDENKLALVEYVQVKANRDKFNSLSKDARLPVAALITKAVELELIRYEKDPMTWVFTDSKKDFTQVPPQMDYNDHLIEFFHNNTHGKKIKDYLEKQIESIYAGKAQEESAKDLAKVEGKK
jgi:hypothetical protein